VYLIFLSLPAYFMKRERGTRRAKQNHETKAISIGRQVGCQAKDNIHNPSCPCIACKKPQDNCVGCPNLTRQHYISKSIAKKLLKWNKKEIDASSNRLWLSNACHNDADRGLAGLYYALREENAHGRKITTEEIVIFREQY